MSEPGKERKLMGDVEPHLRTEGEIRELQPRVDFMAERMCQTQGMVLWALKEAGLTVVLLDPRAREIAPDGAALAVSEKHVNLAYYAAAKCEHQLQGACLSCVERAIAAAEERGRRAGITPDLLNRVLHVLGKVAAGQEDSWTSTIARAVEIELRKALAPRDSGTSCGADEDGIHREARKDRK